MSFPNPFVDDPLLSIERDIIAWHSATFPDVTVMDIQEKLYEEIMELNSPTSFANLIEEIADVCVVAIALLDREGKTLSGAIKDKMAINRTRRWNKNGERV
jgi:NTP pyrophosphatase (non-canonical NTP hydrolase)